MSLKCEGPWEREGGEAKPFPLLFVLCALLSLKKKKKRDVWERGRVLQLFLQGSVYLLQALVRFTALT